MAPLRLPSSPRARTLLGGGILLVAWAVAFLAGFSLVPPASEPPTVESAQELPKPSVEPSDPEAAVPLRLRTCVADFGAVDELDGALAAAVATAEGEPLWQSNAEAAVAPASVLKLFTVVAGWRVLGPEHRLVTRVVQGAQPGEVWLIGGGDATLTRSPETSYYDAEASLQDLAAQVVAANSAAGGAPITTVHLDDTRYRDFPAWNDSWRRGAWALGFVAPITSIQVDGDRDDPAGRLSPRSQDPVSRAGAWFAEALVAAGNPVLPAVGARAEAPSGTALLGQVRSAPLSELIGPVLVDSDNTLAEILAREVALSLGTSSLHDALMTGVGIEGLGDLETVDGSGLSPDNRVPAASSLRVVNEIARDPELAPVRSSLARSGEYGSLRDRFPSEANGPVSSVSAKTGSIEGVRALAGFVDTAAGDTLAFSMSISGPLVDDASREDIDALVAALAGCGENLAHWTPSP